MRTDLASSALADSIAVESSLMASFAFSVATAAIESVSDPPFAVQSHAENVMVATAMIARKIFFILC